MRLQLIAAGAWLLALLAATAHVRADEATGTWTGEVEGVGNYYWERSTRVVVPRFGAKLVAPNGVGVSAGYLVDVISSASIAQTGSDEDAVFTELRHGIGLGVGKEFDLGETPLDLQLHGIYSTEDDYKSLSYGLGAAFSLDRRASVLRLSLNRIEDDIESNADTTRHEELGGFSVGANWEQILGRTLVLTGGYQIGYLEGFLANIYRRALIGPLPFPEDHPRERWRHSAELRLRWLIPATATAIHFMPRAYLDSWDIRALNPEVRVYQELWTPEVVMRLRYRFYTQSAAEFFRASYPQGYMGHVTNDPKMSEFDTHYAGIKFDFQLGFLDGVLDFASRGRLYMNFERIWNTNSFGNGVIAQVGGILPF